MKRILVAAAAAAIMLGMTGCSGNSTGGQAENQNENRTENQADNRSETAEDTETAENAENPGDTEISEEAAEENADEALLPEMKIVTDAIQARVNSDGFVMSTVAQVGLKGNSITGDFEIKDDMKIMRSSEDGLLMATEASSNIDDIVTRSYYRDGTLHVSDGSSVSETDKSEDEVMEGVSQVTDMVLEAAGSVESVDIEETSDGSGTAYSYEIPGYLAKSYLKKLIAQLDISQLDGATINIDNAVLTTVVDGDGMVSRQIISLEGSVHKMIITVPVEVVITADFTSLEGISSEDMKYDF